MSKLIDNKVRYYCNGPEKLETGHFNSRFILSREGSMMIKHKSYNTELKLQVVLEVLKGEKTLAQICREHEVAADLVCHWRDVFLERAPQVFTDPRVSSKGTHDEQRIAELECMVGRLTMELDASKKALRGLSSRESLAERS